MKIEDMVAGEKLFLLQVLDILAQGKVNEVRDSMVLRIEMLDRLGIDPVPKIYRTEEQ